MAKRMLWGEFREQIVPAINNYLLALEAEARATTAREEAGRQICAVSPGHGHQIVDALKNLPWLCDECGAPTASWGFGSNPTLCSGCGAKKRKEEDDARIQAAAEALLKEKDTPLVQPQSA